jgi:hypothetical protein
MGMVWIGYEQTEQLREYGVKMRVSVPHIVSEAIAEWLKYVAPARLKVHGLESLTPTSQESRRLKPNDPTVGMGAAGILEAVETQIRILQGIQDQLRGTPSTIAPGTPKLSPRADKKGISSDTGRIASMQNVRQPKGSKAGK